MTRRLIREGDPPAGQLASPVPQYWNPSTEAFEDVLGAHGAPRAILYGPNGQPINNENPLEVRVRLLEELLGALNAAKETDPDAASASLLALLRGLLASAAKENTLSQLLVALTAVRDSAGIKKIADAVTVSGLDSLATESTLDDVKSALTSLVGAAATETTLDDVKTAAETLAGTVDNGAAKVTLQGSLPPSMMELAVNDWSELPDPTETPKGATAQLIGTFDVRQNTGTEWVEVVL